MQPDAIVLTTYLTQRLDPQRGTLWPPDDDTTVRTWIESARRCGLRAIIFHDDLSPGFTGRWTSPTTRFERISWQDDGWSALEERVKIYRNWLQDNVVDWALTTDLADVEFYSDPFQMMRDSTRLYIGSELNHIGNTCIADWMRRAYGHVSFPNRIILNPGVLGGERAGLVYFLNLYLRELEVIMHRTQPPVDVAVFNRLIYREKIPFITGHPLHTHFKKHEGIESGAAIRHK